MIEALDSDYIFLEMFRAFDFNGVGHIQKQDMDLAAKFMGWEVDQGKFLSFYSFLIFILFSYSFDNRTGSKS